MGDWLGTGVIASRFINYRKYKETEKYVRVLKLKNVLDWNKYCKSGRKPNDIPNAPASYYKNKGWNGWAHFLGKTSETGKENKYGK